MEAVHQHHEIHRTAHARGNESLHTASLLHRLPQMGSLLRGVMRRQHSDNRERTECRGRCRNSMGRT